MDLSREGETSLTSETSEVAAFHNFVKQTLKRCIKPCIRRLVRLLIESAFSNRCIRRFDRCIGKSRSSERAPMTSSLVED